MWIRLVAWVHVRQTLYKFGNTLEFCISTFFKFFVFFLQYSTIQFRIQIMWIWGKHLNLHISWTRACKIYIFSTITLLEHKEGSTLLDWWTQTYLRKHQVRKDDWTWVFLAGWSHPWSHSPTYPCFKGYVDMYENGITFEQENVLRSK